jgi:hypothetical protein
MPERDPPGLPSIHNAREARIRGKYSRVTGNVWLVLLGVMAASLVIYRYVESNQVEGGKEALLAKQRAVVTTLGAEWTPLRDRIEAVTLAAAKEFRGDEVSPEVLGWDFRSAPGIYLRLRVAEAKHADSMRAAASDSLRDAFAACLLREPNRAGPLGVPDAAFSDQPWNLRQAYAATRVLEPSWVANVKEADEPLRLRVFERQYEKAVRDEIPLAVDIVRRAQFFLLVLDEDVDAAREKTDGGPVTLEALTLVPHPARVHLVNLKTGHEVVRVRRTAEGAFMFAGEHAVTDPETREAMQRQVNNCALAGEVQAAIDQAGNAAKKP